MRIKLLVILFLVGCGSVFAQDPWKISTSKVDRSHYYGITVGNGMLGLVSSPEPLKTSCTVLANSYDKFGRGEVSNFLSGFNMLNASLYIDGTEVSYDNIANYTQELDMKTAEFSGKFDYQKKAHVDYSFVSLRELPYCALLKVTVTPRADMDIRVVNTQAIPDGFKNAKFKFDDLTIGQSKAKLLSTESLSPTGRLTMCASSTFLFPDNRVDNAPEVTHQQADSSHAATFTVRLKKGQPYRFAIVGSTLSSALSHDPINEVKRLVVYCQMEGLDKLLDIHKERWAELWKSDIVIDGDAQAQQDVHSMIYHLYSFVSAGSDLSISPMGLSGLGYNGHVFWDADVWMFPALLMLQPEMAKSMINYRYDRLSEAKRYAFEHGYQGAQYPWESADTGGEDTPVWAMTGPFEHSISGCVAFAAWQYYCVTGDKNWLKEKGFPIIKETADFWLSRVQKDETGVCHILNVVAADEWAENIDDDAFTNGIAIANLRIAAKAARLLGMPVNSQWEETANHIPVYKMANGVTREHNSYKGENIKQADVNLLAFPLMQITDPAQVRKDLEYYQQRIPNEGTPAMTQAIFTLLYSRLGDADNAYKYFNDAYVENLLPPFRVFAETKNGTNPYFATGAGGILQSLIMGFGGVDIDLDNGGIRQVKSVLPKKWKKLTLTSIGPEHKSFTVTNR